MPSAAGVKRGRRTCVLPGIQNADYQAGAITSKEVKALLTAYYYSISNSVPFRVAFAMYDTFVSIKACCD